MKNIPVACAIIEKHGKILATQRSASMRMPLKWEFPGGKIDTGENPEECLKRELREELGIEVDVKRFLAKVTYSYPEFSVTLYPFICKVVGGEITLCEHVAMRWLAPEELETIDWSEADLKLISECGSLLQHSTCFRISRLLQILSKFSQPKSMSNRRGRECGP